MSQVGAGELVFLQPTCSTTTAATDQTYTGDAFDVSSWTNFTAFATVGTVTATTTALAIFLQGSFDGSTWFDLMHDGALKSAPTTSADQTGSAAGKRNIASLTTAGDSAHVAYYRGVIFKYIRSKVIMDVDTDGVWNDVTVWAMGR